MTSYRPITSRRQKAENYDAKAMLTTEGEDENEIGPFLERQKIGIPEKTVRILS